MTLHLVKISKNNGRYLANKNTSIAATLFISLLLLQLRVLLTMPDNDGSIRYLLVAFAILIGANISRKSWQMLFQHFTISGLIIALNYWLNWHPGSDIWLIEANKYIFKEGFGGINMLMSVLNIFFLISTYTLRMSYKKTTKIFSSLTAFATFSLCLASNSRMAAIAPILALFISWFCSSGRHKIKQFSTINRLIYLGWCIITPLLACWYFVVKPDWQSGMLSDKTRIQIWACSLKNSILDGNNKIAFGNGYEWLPIKESCGHWQAHSSYIHFLSMHGVLGILGIIAIMLLVVKGIRGQLRQNPQTSSFWLCSWSESALGCILLVAITALSSTTYLGGYLNPLLIGLILSMGLVPTQGKSRLKKHDV